MVAIGNPPAELVAVEYEAFPALPAADTWLQSLLLLTQDNHLGQ